MRLFLAIDIPEHIKDTLDQQLEPLRREYGDMNWIPKKHFHITTLYLGDIPGGVEAVRPNIEQAVFYAEPFSMITLTGGVWIHRSLTLYLDFYRVKQLDALVGHIDEAFQYERDLKYIPHLTIGKARIPSKQQYHHLKKKLENFKPDLEFEIDELTLFKSDLSGPKPVYTPMERFKLGQ